MQRPSNFQVHTARGSNEEMSLDSLTLSLHAQSVAVFNGAVVRIHLTMQKM